MDPASQMKLLETALAHHQAGRINEAEAIYRKVLLEHPSNVDALHLLGVIMAGRGKPADALPLLQKAASLQPSFMANMRDLGYVLALLGHHQEALAAYARVLQGEPRDPALRADIASELFA